MSLSVEVGLLLALGNAFASVVGFLYKQRGAVESPAVELRRPVRTSLALFRSRWYVLGISIAMGAWGLHVAALSLAPISLVQSVIAGGLVLLTVTAHGLFDHEVTRREWIGVGLAALGLAFLSATIGGTGDNAYSAYDAARLWPWWSALPSPRSWSRRGPRQGPRGVILRHPRMFWAAPTLDQGPSRTTWATAPPRCSSTRWRLS
jgi:drug/metabolite transporter (DMT)-like permease